MMFHEPDSSAASDARLDDIAQGLYERLRELQIPRRDVYNVDYCPSCGERFDLLREVVQHYFASRGKPVTLPPHVCLNCGLDCRRVTIAPEA